MLNVSVTFTNVDAYLLPTTKNATCSYTGLNLKSEFISKQCSVAEFTMILLGITGA